MAAVVATALTIHTGQDMSVGVAVGIAAGALGVQLDVIAQRLKSFFVNTGVLSLIFVKSSFHYSCFFC